jgi:hypothetical protein
MFKQFEDFKEIVDRNELSYNECIVPKENIEGKVPNDSMCFWNRKGYYLLSAPLPDGSMNLNLSLPINESPHSWDKFNTNEKLAAFYR